MSPYDDYPPDYRAAEVQSILHAIGAGECVSVVGLSGSGKSNLLGYLAHYPGIHSPVGLLFFDCNRLPENTPQALFQSLFRAFGGSAESSDFAVLDAAIGRKLEAEAGLCLLLDRFEVIASHPQSAGMLRALRDNHKYALTYITATRRPLDARSELAELFYAHIIWLGPLSESDACWNVARYAARRRLSWDESTASAIVAISGGYPSLLRAVCEAYAGGAPLELAMLSENVAIRRRLDEFWADRPTQEELAFSRLAGNPLLTPSAAPAPVENPDLTLTNKEHLLLEYFRAHPGEICAKDDLIRAVWPEDRVYLQGIRDDSLAQLIRRLREKIEPQPSAPRHIHTLPGRGYRFRPE